MRSFLRIHEPEIANEVKKILGDTVIRARDQEYIAISSLEDLENLFYNLIIKERNRKKGQFEIDDLYLDRLREYSKGLIEQLINVTDALNSAAEANHKKTVSEYEAELSGVSLKGP